MNRSPVRSLFSADHSLARMVTHFNFCPADYLHSTKRSFFLPGIESDDLWAASRARRCLSAFILSKLKLNNIAFLEMDRMEWAIALLGPAQLMQLRRYIAAAIFQPAIKRSLSQKEVTQWRNILGPQAYKFSLTGTNFIATVSTAVTAQDLSEVDSIASGWIEVAMSTAPAPMRTRANLKLPANVVLPHVEAKDAQRLIGSLLSILDPRWHLYFLKNQH